MVVFLRSQIAVDVFYKEPRHQRRTIQALAVVMMEVNSTVQLYTI